MSTNTTTVTVEITDRRPTIEDIQAALDVLRAEGIPDTFEVNVLSTQEREYDANVPPSQRRVMQTFRMTAERAAKTKATR